MLIRIFDHEKGIKKFNKKGFKGIKKIIRREDNNVTNIHFYSSSECMIMLYDVIGMPCKQLLIVISDRTQTRLDRKLSRKLNKTYLVA
jgi:hypothetical protein